MFPTRLTREGWYFTIVLAFIVVAGSMREINLMLILAGMMVGVLYFNWRGARSMLRRLQVHRRLPESIHAGEMLTVELEATSPSRSLAVVVQDTARPHGAGRDAAVLPIAVFPQVPAKQAVGSQYRLTLERRGQYDFGPLRISTRYPFGLMVRTIRQPERGRLLVLPRLGRLTAQWNQLAQTPDFGSRRAARRQGQTEGDFYGLRDWRAGDSRRLIHWRTSARRGGLMVRQFERPWSVNLTLLLELWQPENPGSDDRRRVELAVAMAATVAVDACRRGESQLLVIVGGQGPVVAHGGGASRSLAREILGKLAVAEASSSDRLAELLERGADEAPPGGRTVLLTTRPAAMDPAARLAAATTADGGLVAQRVVVLPAGSAEFERYFQLS